MGDFEILRVNNGTSYFQVAGCVEVSFSACTSNIAQVITFYDNIFINVNQGIQGISEYLMVHEMGHRFNARSDGGGSGGQGRSAESLYGRMICQTVGTNTVCLTVNDFAPTNAGVVFGYSQSLYRGVYYPDWVRGKRGWGTGPHAPFNEDGYLPNGTRDQTQYITNFQQNSFSIHDRSPNSSDAREDEVDEVVADMFLNWVYYEPTGQSSGFKDWSWAGDCENSTGCSDSTRPGFARFNWMQIQMNDIFNKRGW